MIKKTIENWEKGCNYKDAIPFLFSLLEKTPLDGLTWEMLYSVMGQVHKENPSGINEEDFGKAVLEKIKKCIPKFTKGDFIYNVSSNQSCTILEVCGDHYKTSIDSDLPFDYQDYWTLVPDPNEILNIKEEECELFGDESLEKELKDYIYH